MTTKIIRKPKWLYPLPENLKDLDEPWHESNRSRFIRIASQFKDGYDSSEDPTIVKPPRSKSKLLSKLR